MLQEHRCAMAEWSPPPQGGFDCDFVEPPPNRLYCGICHHLLRDPLLSSCGHSFCTSCHRTSFHISQLCPVCNQRYTTLPDANIARDVKSLQVRCRSKQAGCEWTGNLENVKEHMANCLFASSWCGKCGQLMQRRLMLKHQVSLCPLRQYRCNYCRMYVNTYNDVTANHWPICEFFPEPCPNDCPKGSVPRNCLMEHIRSECTVKKDANQLVEIKSQCHNLLEEVHHLQECLERRNRKKELEREYQEMQQELRKKDEKISEMKKDLEELRKKLHQPSASTSWLETCRNAFLSLSRPGWVDDDPESKKWREDQLKW